MRKTIGQYKSDLEELKTKEISLKQVLYKKYVMMSLLKTEEEKEKLRKEIMGLEETYESLCDLINEKEKELDREREKKRKR